MTRVKKVWTLVMAQLSELSRNLSSEYFWLAFCVTKPPTT